MYTVVTVKKDVHSKGGSASFLYREECDLSMLTIETAPPPLLLVSDQLVAGAAKEWKSSQSFHKWIR